jgi:copper chaperone CopZ
MRSSTFFYVLIGISLGAATLSSFIYLKRNQLFHKEGIKRKWKYLSLMYGLTIGVNLLFFMLILPLFATSAGAASEVPNGAQLTLKVQIPCGGHAPLITQELQKVEGVQGIKFSLPNYFKINYDPSKTSPQEILSLPIFLDFPAKVVG